MQIKKKIWLKIFSITLVVFAPFVTFASIYSKTGQSTSITQTSATLYGNFGGTDAASITTSGFEYGPTGSYGSSTSGTFDFVKNTFLPDISTSGYTYIGGVDTDSNGNIYISGQQSFPEEIQKYDSNGNFILKFGESGSGLGQFLNLTSVKISPANKIFAIDSGNYRIQVFDLDGSNPYIFKTFENVNLGGSLYREIPRDVGFDTDGNVYVLLEVDVGTGGSFTSFADKVFKYDSSGNFIGGLFSVERFFATGISLDSSNNNIYISGQGKVFKLNSFGVQVASIETTGSAEGQFNGAIHSVVDSNGDVFVTDYLNYRIQKLDSNLNFIYSFPVGTSGLNYPFGITTNQDGDVIVTVIDESINHIEILNDNFNLNLSGLSCGTTYHYRSYSTDGVSTSYGGDKTFTTNDCDEPAPSGGGGGGSSSGSRLPYVRITDNLSETKTSDVSLDVFTPEAVEGFSLSNTSDFKLKIDYANVQRGVKKINWNLCYGIEVCNAGQKIIYAKFIHPSDSYLGEYDDATILYNPDLPKIVCPYFIGFAKKGWNNNREEVRKIQTFLNQNTNAEIVEDGIFGIKTEKAVKDFQQKYFMQIIAPWIDVTGLQKPSGWWFKTTAAWANSLLGCPTVVSDFSI